MKTKRYTLKDIAELAHVSRGTVDRVVHGRGKVSKEAYSRVKQVLDKIDYQPNLVAQSLRKGVLHEIAVLMPGYNYEKYWKKPLLGVEKATNEYTPIGINIRTFLFNPSDSGSYREKYTKILNGRFSAVLVAPFFYKESLVFFEACKKSGLPYFTFNTYIENSGAVTHVGQDLVRSGRTAGSLMHKVLADGDEYLVVHINEELENSMHMQDKESGFRQFLAEAGVAPGQIHVLNIDISEKLEPPLLQKLGEVDALKGIYVTNSKVWMIAGILQQHELDRLLIGYDLLDENIQYLNAGKIDYLIFQNPQLQTSLGIQTIIDYLLFKQEIPDKTFFPVEIVIRENLKEFIT